MGLGEDRREILTKYGPYVRSLAAQVRKQFNANLELDELISYGQVGLLEAADRFDAKVGANFLTFAHYRIKGAIFDGLRKMGVLKGGDQRTQYGQERATAYLGNLSDREQGGGGRGGTFDDDVRDVANAVTGLAVLFATSLEGLDGLNVPDESLPVDQRLELEQLKKRVRAAMEQLPEKERKLLEGYYFRGKTLEEAGAEIGQSKSWASRLHARAIEELKRILAEDEVPSDKPRARASSAASMGAAALRRKPHMAGPLMSAPVSAQQIAQQKLQDQAGQPSSKAGGPSKFDGMMAQKAQQAEAAQAAQKAQGAEQVNKARFDPMRLLNLKATRVDHQKTALPNKSVTQPSLAQKVGLQNDIKTLQQTVGADGPKGQNVAVKMMGDIEKGQGVMDRLIQEGLSGRHFENSELLALQAGMYKYTQELELTGKVVEKATSGLKDTLKTQV